ncbi:MAG: LacI family DNA-binding transcriptional regulator [Verrucomicrobia bacterium]|nr:LacI family DNA-binding transcriptional regulator [Verrucomicrobiota bacterium]MBV8280197.1 LacI family DNA-binding transcriptional regulator [Verrucomicrobiota bacterium]
MPAVARPPNNFDLFFYTFLRHTGSAVPADFTPDSNTMAIRLKDLAHHLKLSVSTISAALQNREDISEATRVRVFAAVKKFGYHPNSLARGLVTRKTNVLGVVVPDLSRSFFAEVLKGIDSVTSAAGYNLLVCNTEENAPREEEMLRMLLSNQVDGLLLASAHEPSNTSWRKILAGLSVPMVLIDRRLPGLNFVGGDDSRIGFQATRHLYDQGYRRIAHIAGPQTVTTAVGRLHGYRRALATLALPSDAALVMESNYHEESGGYEAMQRLLKLPSPPDAVFAASDPIAIGALQAALEANLSLPADFGLIGVGNHRYGQFLKVPLSTVDQQRSQIGRSAAELLLTSMEKKRVRPKSILTEPKLVVRDSSNRTGVSGILIATVGVKRNAKHAARR